MNYADLGKKVKEKYPQYKNLSDDEVGQKVAKKYPQYQSQIDSEASQEQSGSSSLTSGDTLQNTGQLLGGILSARLPKPARVVAGAAGRTAGEMARQSLAPETSSIKDASKILMGLLSGKKINEQILSNEEQAGARSRLSSETAGQQLKDLGKEAGVGLLSEGIGEYVVGPIVGKTIENVVSPAIAGGRRIIGKGVEALGDVADKTPVVGAVKRWGVEMIEKAKDYRVKERVANELLNIRPGNKIAQEAEEKLGVNLGKEFTKDITKVSNKYGKDALGKDLYGTVNKYKDEVVVKAMDEATKRSEKTVKLEGFMDEVNKKAAQLNRQNAGFGDKYKEEVLGWLQRNTGADFKPEISMKEAWEYRKELDNFVRTTTGELPSSIDVSSPQKTAYNDIADALRKELNSDKTIEPLFREWQNFDAYSKQLLGRDVPRLPATISILQNILKSARDPQFLTKELLRESPQAVTTQPKIPGNNQLEQLLEMAKRISKQQTGVGVVNSFRE